MEANEGIGCAKNSVILCLCQIAIVVLLFATETSAKESSSDGCSKWSSWSSSGGSRGDQGLA